MPNTIRVNIRHRVANAKIRSEKRNGRDVMIIPSAVAKFDSVLNGILYPREELESSYQGLNRTPAPLGHPVINGQHVSARDPEAINTHHIGAHNENARIEGDRVMADMVLDVEYAKRHPEGQALLDAINAGDPISTSTGLYMERFDAPEDAEYQYVGRNYSFDHNAILLNEAPAIGTEEGIGLMVNAKGEAEEVPVINSEMDDEELEGALNFAFEVLERKDKRQKRNGLTSQVVAFMQKLLNYDSDKTDDGQPGPNVNRKEEVSEMTQEELQAALDKQAAALTEALQANFDAKLAEAVKPLHDQLEANKAAAEAAEKAEHDKAVEAVVNAKLMEQEEAEQVPTMALNAMLKASKRAHGIVGGSPDTNAAKDEWADYDLNAAMEDK